ncbi:trifunctional serine/threonine-protein kinase/ATP-binding protein/sensor histidine kinase [Nostoc sp. 'Peltigera membranacea cyanobiont' N6]|uniref:trifunctional serine/threonine-protein kinase/ATP-binding protein/sensor histidine kinase n=1 Tax=Nostoc sp. 'Peltigera membranacea cyanobiont' N6 TaxID=1261031 RepID=UPI000CF346F3|nr:AAA family ATPase [Nostoc sp. 'Peltigera membranacea cyanobiont' N6]AVH62118.1 multi-sensor signal transduction multi-kinase [Nostoc sp. 'Peltigera membranacea cyanobiont' N6]
MTLVSIPGYQVSEELYNGSRTLVYRAVREIDREPVAIKLLKNLYPSFSELVQFRNQYTIVKNLNSPLIVQTYSLEPFQNGYSLVMEDFGGISLKEYFAVLETRYIASIEEFLEIAIALCNTLDILYHERIIHKDIKPSNILINPETKQVKLIDFSIASLLPRETQTLVNPNVLEGTLAYISPEQTGRMNRVIDYRTDFYSLGVTFYELLTGELPFASNDPMELVHSHLAKTAPLGHKINPQIPAIISEIVSKLMMKNAEDRYQSALGLKFDLEKCLHQLKETGEIQSFEIASKDLCDRFIIPDKLYGRDQEVQTLLEAFERVSLGATEMMLVAGFSGIGKTAVVNEVHKPIVRQRGYFIKGKYDQFQRNIPFSAFVQVFRDLMGQLLTESDIQLEEWKNKILEAVGDNGKVIIDVIPELEKIIGAQPPAAELSGAAAQNRFNLLFEKFTQVFTTKEHPLVMFLDDLQWADSASLKLMQLLMADTGHLFIIGAYRDNEVNPGHSLMLTLSEIQKTQAIINTITLAPLSKVQVNKLVADTLKCSNNLASSLAELVYQKTQGNPFFTTQFIKALHQDKLITFDFELNCWQCDIIQIKTLAATDDVIAFMSLQLQKLPLSTQQVLQLAACIGNQFDLGTLAIVAEQSQIETAACLWKALQEGLILPIGDVYKFYVGQESIISTSENQEIVTYKFLHDRVQQAAYSLIPDDQKQLKHLKIGQLLLQGNSQIEQEEYLFDIVGHLNLGFELLHSTEKPELARLNLAAGQKANISTAYSAGAEYALFGIKLLEANCWQHQYPLALALYETAAEGTYLSGDFEQMDRLTEVVLQKDNPLLDKIKSYELKIQKFQAQNKLLDAVKLALDVLELLGEKFSLEPDTSETEQAFKETLLILDNRDTLSLIDLPEMTDPYKLAVMRILSTMFASTYLSSPKLLPLIILKQVNLSLEYGNASESASAYAKYGLLLCAIVNNIDLGYQFSELALRLLEDAKVKDSKAHTINVACAAVQFWKKSLRIATQLFIEGYQSGLESGDIQNASHCIMNYLSYAYYYGKELFELEREMSIYGEVIAKLKQKSCLQNINSLQQTVMNLVITVEKPQFLEGDFFSENVEIPRLNQSNDRTALAFLYIQKLMLSYLFGEIAQARKIAVIAEQYLDGVPGMFWVPIFYWYDTLTQLAGYSELTDVEQKENIWVHVLEKQAKMRQWADRAPTNFLHKYDLVEAQRHQILGKTTEAIDLYDRAISGAKANEYIQEEALANELAAKFYLDWGKEKVAAGYMQEAYYCYAKWGAKAKVADLEQRYPQLLAPILQQSRSVFSTNETIFTVGTVTSSSTSVSDTLDLTAILKASQTISGEIELSKLISSLLSIIIENAGADKCVLMLLQDNHLLIAGSISQETQPVVLQSLPIEDSQDIPHKLIYKVKRNQKTFVLLDATADITFANDPYIIRQQPQSILCNPILHQGKLLGILYLENNLVKGAFTSDRVELLNFLCAQAAISLENARLYEQQLEYSQQLERSLEELSTAQSVLQSSQQRLQLLVQQTPLAVIEWDTNYQVTDWNPAAERIFGYSKQEALGCGFKFIIPEKIQGEMERVSVEIISQEGGNYSINENVTKDGKIIICAWYNNPLVSADGELIGVASLADDITEQQAALRERKVAEVQLQEKAQELEAALQNLQQAQLQMVQTEKMSALGNLVAGVAHEMNNPLGFIAASLKQAKPTIADIVEHLRLYQSSFPNKSDEIKDHAEEIDLDYSLEDLPKMIDSMSMACDRLKNISTSLRTFSRADRDYKVPFNIHQGIDSTILILKHRLKDNEQRPAIQVVANYGNLPEVECFPGQLNQVFMNIFANAIDALDESNHGLSLEEIKANPNCITITTSVENNLVKVAIRDNGKGINEQVKQKIFDHLFTTKAVGKGTGLGLAIARQIVESTHGGKLSFNSVIGEGTEFIIEIPV